MDFFIVLGALVFLAYFDTNILRKINEPLFEVVWGTSRWKWIGLFALAGLLLSSQRSSLESVGQEFWGSLLAQLVFMGGVGGGIFLDGENLKWPAKKVSIRFFRRPWIRALGWYPRPQALSLNGFSWF